MPDIRASAEVRALIGAENLAELEKDAYASFRCPECGLPGTTVEPTSVVARRFRKTVTVDLAHAACTRSLVDDIDADPPPGLGLDGGWADMRVMTLVLEYRDAPQVRPLLLLERRIETARFTAGGEKINVTLAALLRGGLEPVRSASHLPRPGRGWRLRRPDHCPARLRGRHSARHQKHAVDVGVDERIPGVDCGFPEHRALFSGGVGDHLDAEAGIVEQDVNRAKGF